MDYNVHKKSMDQSAKNKECIMKMKKTFVESLRQYPEEIVQRTTPRKVILSESRLREMEKMIIDKTKTLSHARIYAFDGYLGCKFSDYGSYLTIENKYNENEIKKKLSFQQYVDVSDYIYVTDKEHADAHAEAMKEILCEFGFTNYICKVEEYTKYIYSTGSGFWGTKLDKKFSCAGYAIHISLKW